MSNKHHQIESCSEPLAALDAAMFVSANEIQGFLKATVKV